MSVNVGLRHEYMKRVCIIAMVAALGGSCGLSNIAPEHVTALSPDHSIVYGRLNVFLSGEDVTRRRVVFVEDVLFFPLALFPPTCLFLADQAEGKKYRIYVQSPGWFFLELPAGRYEGKISWKGFQPSQSFALHVPGGGSALCVGSIRVDLGDYEMRDSGARLTRGFERSRMSIRDNCISAQAQFRWTYPSYRGRFEHGVAEWANR